MHKLNKCYNYLFKVLCYCFVFSDGIVIIVMETIISGTLKATLLPREEIRINSNIKSRFSEPQFLHTYL